METGSEEIFTCEMDEAKILVTSKKQPDKIRKRKIILFIAGILSFVLILYLMFELIAYEGSFVTMFFVIITYPMLYASLEKYIKNKHKRVWSEKFINKIKETNEKHMISKSELHLKEKIDKTGLNKIYSIDIIVSVSILTIYVVILFIIGNLGSVRLLLYISIILVGLFIMELYYNFEKEFINNLEISFDKEKLRSWGHVTCRYNYELDLKDIKQILIIYLEKKDMLSIVITSELFYYTLADIYSDNADISGFIDFLETNIEKNENLKHLEIKQLDSDTYQPLIQELLLTHAMIFSK